MNRNSLTTAVIAGIAGVAGIANLANAVNINPDGLGQVLIYPYYTTNAGQATLLSVVNTTAVGKAVKVRFLEGYNSREVLDFNLFLSKYDVWTAEVFKLSDAGVGGDGAAIFTTDNSCTYPSFSQGPLGNGAMYEPFKNFAYQDDGGPTDDTRTLEGYFEMISMADAVVDSNLEFDITHVGGVPSDCGSAESDLLGDSTYTAPTSGLFGAASVVNVAQGTFYAYNADAIDGFTYVPLVTPSGSLDPSLLAVNDPASLTTATSYVFNDGALLTSTWPSIDPNSRPIDAVSSLFDAANIYNEYEQSAGAVGTDWVVTFPTKRFYVDAATYGFTTVIPPFEELFSQTTDGKSCTILGIGVYDREERTTSTPTCGFSPCPPGQPPSSICHEVNVITFGPSGTASILGSTTLNQNIATPFGAGWVNLTLTGNGHDLPAASNGNIFHGLPVTGFQARNFINGQVSPGVLANYSGVYKHRISRDCTNVAGACS